MLKKLRYVGIWVGGQLEFTSILLDSWYLFGGGIVALFLVAIPLDIISFFDWSIKTFLIIIGLFLALYFCAIIFNINFILKRGHPDWGMPCKEQKVLMKTFSNKEISNFDKLQIKKVLRYHALDSEKRNYASSYISIGLQLKIQELFELFAYYSLDHLNRNKLIAHLTKGVEYYKTDSNLFYMRAIAYSLAEQPEEAYNDIQSAIKCYNLYPSNRKYDIFSQRSSYKYKSALDEYKAILNFNSRWGFSVGGQALDYLKKLNSEQIY